MYAKINIEFDELKRIATEAGILIPRDERERSMQFFLEKISSILLEMQGAAWIILNPLDQNNIGPIEGKLPALRVSLEKSEDFFRSYMSDLKQLIEEDI